MKKIVVVFTALLATTSVYSANKKTFIEDLTGAWCGYCPRGPIEMENLKKKYPNNFIGITQHSGDGMENTFSSTICNKAEGFPSFMIDRKLDSDLPSNLTTTSPVAIEIKQLWNSSTRTVSGTITVKIESAPPKGVLNIGLMVVEDKVVGTGTNYDQKNFYNTTNEYPELKGKGDPIKGYQHYMVQRDCPLGGINGKSEIIANPPVVGASYSTPFTYVFPAKYGSLDIILSNLYLIAFTGIKDGAILNAEQIKLDLSTPIREQSEKLVPASKNFSLISSGAALELNVAVAGKYTVTLYSLSSQKIVTLSDSYMSSGIHRLDELISNLQSGIYIANINCVDGSFMKKVSILK